MSCAVLLTSLRRALPPALLLIGVVAIFATPQRAKVDAATVDIALTEEPDGRAIVLPVFAALADLDGYHFEMTRVTVSRFIETDATAIASHNWQKITGDVASDGDYLATTLVTGGESAASLLTNPRLQLDQVRIGEEVMLQFQADDPVYAAMVPLSGGWQTEAALLETLSADSTVGLAARITVVNAAALTLPHEFDFDSGTVQTVTELEPETLDGIPMRVFAVEMNAVPLMIRSMQRQVVLDQQAALPRNARDPLHTLLETGALLGSGEFSAGYTLWIGAADGWLYRATGETYSLLPYTRLDVDGPPYDVEYSSTLDLSISRHDEPVTISAPEVSEPQP